MKKIKEGSIKWYEREAKRQKRRNGGEVMIHRSRGNRYWNEVPEMSPAGEKWADPAGGVHYGEEVNFEQYE